MGRLERRRDRLLRMTGLHVLKHRGRGEASTRIALIDGPVHATHPALASARIVSCLRQALGPSDPFHATFIASTLVGSGRDVLGIAPGCTLLSFPIHDADFQNGRLPAGVAAARVAHAIDRAVEERAHVIQLSMDFAPERDAAFGCIRRAIERAALRGICTVIAAGNRPRLGGSAVLACSGVLVAAMATDAGEPHPESPLGPAVGAGILVPGSSLPGAAPPDGFVEASGSSFAASFATGALALLKSLRPELSTRAIAQAAPAPHVRSTVPPLLDAWAWFVSLTRQHRSGEPS